MITPIETEATWLTALASAPVWHPPAQHTLVIAPHPDDETLGIGGLIARLRQHGTEVTVIAVTDGENCYQGEHLGAIRPAEQAAALTRLGVDAQHTHHLHLPDSGLHHHGIHLESLIFSLATNDMHLVAPWQHDFHPDHEVCGRAALKVAQRRSLLLTSYLFWTWHRGTTDLLQTCHTVRLPLTQQQQAAKREALACHRSQLTHPSEEPILPDYLLQPAWRDFEVFLPA